MDIAEKLGGIAPEEVDEMSIPVERHGSQRKCKD